VALTAPSALAQSAPVTSNDWTITLGAEGRLLPTFPGSDNYMFRPVPLIDLRRAGTERKFTSSRDGASLGLVDTGNFRFGPTAKVQFSRRERDDNALRGLGNVDYAIEVGAFAEYWLMQWLRTRVDVRQGFLGHHGVVADFSADAVFPVTRQLTLSAGPRLTAVTAKANDPYYSIDAAQSLASGLPIYSASGGLQSYGFGGLARYEWTPRWATHAFVEYSRLTDSAADSPLVTLRGNPNQFQFGLGAAYSFNVHALW
jgi:outer membrane protein